jgi:glyoxylate reductase
MRVSITRPVPEVAKEILLVGIPGVVLEGPEIVPGIDALLCTLQDPVDRALMASLAPTLKVVANFAVGLDNIDLEAAQDLGIRVTNTPGVLTDATAEVAIGLMLACARRFREGDRIMRSGTFEGWEPLFHLGRSIYGSTVGIVGAGRIGRRVGETMEQGFGCRVLYHRPTDLDELLAQSDFVSLHCPLTDQTRHLIDARRLRLMKRTAVLINTARGPVVDEAALVDALRGGMIAGAGLDVYEAEPSMAHGLADLDNVLLLPHIGSATVATRDAMARMAASSIVAVLTRESEHEG